MLGKLPFSARIFWLTFIVVTAVVAVGWIIAVWLFGYVMKPADYVGTTISGILLVYLVHLWMLPAEQLRRSRDDLPPMDVDSTEEENVHPGSPGGARP